MSEPTDASTPTRSPAQLFALVSAVVYLSAGVLGFLVTGADDWVGLTGERLVILGINPLHNVVHLVLGTVWLAGARNDSSARLTNTVLGLGLLAAFVLGMAGGGTFLNIDGPAEPDNYLHLLWGGASVYLGTSAAFRLMGSRS